MKQPGGGTTIGNAGFARRYLSCIYLSQMLALLGLDTELNEQIFLAHR